ncbi:hypothetical protein D9M68_919930 [compost metagenome]
MAAAVTTSGTLVMWLEFIVVSALATTSGPAMKPTRQPGMPYVFDSESTNTVRSRNSGRACTKLVYARPSNSMRL